MDGFVASVSNSTCSVGTIPPDDSFEIDGLQPRCVIRPQDETAVARCLTEAQHRGLAVSPVGSGGHLQIGNVPSAYDGALDMTGLDGTLQHEPDDLTVTVAAGVRFGAMAETLARHRQWLPVDAEAQETIGGLIARNGFGPLRHAYGTLRDWVIGLRVAHADGTLSKSGGRVVKNVAGYDMHKLHIGAFGSLGVITQATFKVASVPQEQVKLGASFESADAACAFVLAARDGGAALLSAEVHSPHADRPAWHVALRAGGSPAAIERTRRDLGGLARNAGAALADADPSEQPRSHEGHSDAPLVIRLSVPPSRVAQALTTLSEGPDARLAATVAAGVIRIESPADRATLVLAQRAAAGHDGSLFVESAPVAWKRDIDVFGARRDDFAIMARLKDQFDPDRTLSPGRFMGRL
jgi:glycolate oxidase FAD binding subunit